MEDTDEPLPVMEPRAVAAPARGGAHVGVLPLQLVGTSEDEAHLATGLAEEITTALARFRWMFVVSSNSLARFAMESRDETAIRRTFRIVFLLVGTIQKEQTTPASRCACLTCARAIRSCGHGGLIARNRTTCCHWDEIAIEVVAQIDPGNPADRSQSHLGVRRSRSPLPMT